MVITATNHLRNLIILLWNYSLKWGSSYPMFLNHTCYDSTCVVCEHIYHTVQFNRKDQLCFIVAAYFPLQVFILAFVQVNTLSLKMSYKICGNIQLSKLLQPRGAQPCALSLGSSSFGLLHHHENQMPGVLSSGNWWGSQCLMKSNVNSWPTLFSFD